MATVNLEHVDKNEVKTAAKGRMIDILVHVAGIPLPLLDGKHHPCPACGGTDRFRFVDAEAGAVHCNQCFRTKCGDFLAAVQYFRHVAFPEAMGLVAEYLGMEPTVSGKKQLTFASCDQLVHASEKWYGPLSYRHDYCSANGHQIGCVLRWDLPDVIYGDRHEYAGWQQLRCKCDQAGKPFPPRIIHQASLQQGKWIAKGMTTPRSLYRLQDVIAADQVLICEGEKAVDEAWMLAAMAVLYPPFAVTTSPGGAKQAHLADWQVLAGKRVTIWPDADDAGLDYAKSVFRELRKCCPAPKVRVFDPAKLGLAGKDDLVEFIAVRRDAGQDDYDTYLEIFSWLL